MEIKVEKQTVLASEGGFEPHPEGYTPRVMVAVSNYPQPQVYELLQNGQAIPWPCLPVLECFDYWVIYVEHLSDVDIRRHAVKPKTEIEVQGKKFPLLTFPKDVADVLAAVSQADGYAERESGAGALDHLPEGSH